MAKDMQVSSAAFFPIWHFKKVGQKIHRSLHSGIVSIYHNERLLRQYNFQTSYLIQWLCWSFCVTSVHVEGGGRGSCLKNYTPKCEEENVHLKDTDFMWKNMRWQPLLSSAASKLPTTPKEGFIFHLKGLRTLPLTFQVYHISCVTHRPFQNRIITFPNMPLSHLIRLSGSWKSLLRFG